MNGPGDGSAPSDRDPELPLDSDIEVRARARPVHLRARFLGVVAVGGAVGTAVREGAELVVRPIAGLPVATFAVNVVGAFVLGALLAALARRGPDEGRRRTLRLLLGTGFCGGLTTYSTFATETALLAGRPADAALVLATTLVVGGLATAAGIAVGSRIAR